MFFLRHSVVFVVVVLVVVLVVVVVEFCLQEVCQHWQCIWFTQAQDLFRTACGHYATSRMLQLKL